MDQNTDKIVTLIEAKIDVLPPDVIRVLAYRLPYNSVAYLCQSLKKFSSRICNNDEFQINYGLRYLTSNPDNLPKENGHYTVIKELDKLEKMRNAKFPGYPYKTVEFMIDYYEYLVNNNYDQYVISKERNFFNKQRLLKAASEAGNLNIVKRAVENGANVLAMGDDLIVRLYPEIADTKEKKEKLRKYLYMKPTVIAAENGYLDIVKYLVENGAGPADINDELFTAAGKSGNLDLLKYLISIDNSIDTKEAALNSAIIAGHQKMVKYLVDNGVNIPSDALYLAAEGGNIEMLEYLMTKYDLEIDPEQGLVEAASESGNLELVKYLVNLGVDPHTASNLAITSAAKYGNLDILKYLVSLGLNPSAHGGAALINASKEGHLDVVKYLYEQGVKDNKNSALQNAARNGRLNVVRYMLYNGANPKWINYDQARPNIKIFLNLLRDKMQQM